MKTISNYHHNTLLETPSSNTTTNKVINEDTTDSNNNINTELTGSKTKWSTSFANSINIIKSRNLSKSDFKLMNNSSSINSNRSESVDLTNCAKKYKFVNNCLVTEESNNSIVHTLKSVRRSNLSLFYLNEPTIIHFKSLGTFYVK